MRTGGIPTKIALYVKAPQKFAAHNQWMQQFQRSESADLIVSPAMPTDAESKAQRATAQEWASNYGQIQFTIKEGDNTPFKVRIIGLEARGEGGRAWKVITEDGLLFDMREEILLECIAACGIAAGGAPNGEFIFAREGSQMKIIRVGSDIHAEFTAAETRRTAAPLKKGELKPGVYYSTRGPAHIIYMGRYCKGGQHLSLKVLPRTLDRQTPAQLLDYIVKTGHTNGATWQTTNSLSVVAAVEELPLPADYVQRLRTAAQANVLQYLDATRYGRKMTKQEMAQQARAALRMATQLLNFDPEAEPNAESKEYQDAVSAIVLMEQSSSD